MCDKKMKKIYLLIMLFVFLVGCGNTDIENLYGEYYFEEVSYLSFFSSSTSEYLETKMERTKYIVEENLFKIELLDNISEISNPNYVGEEIPSDSEILADIGNILGNDIEYQYSIYSKNGDKTYLRLYVSSDSIWIASYADNTADRSEIIMYIYKLSR